MKRGWMIFLILLIITLFLLGCKEQAGSAYRATRSSAQIEPAPQREGYVPPAPEEMRQEVPEEPIGEEQPMMPPEVDESWEPNGVKIIPNLTYAIESGKKLQLDLYLPESPDALLPTVVWLHHGGWRIGSKEGCEGRKIAQYGYAVACINYRLTDTAIFPAQIHDVKAAVRWLRANANNYGLDTYKFAAAGASAGGHLAALLGTSGGVDELEGDQNPGYSSKVSAVVDWFGPTEFFNVSPTWQKEGIPEYMMESEIEYYMYFELVTWLVGAHNQPIYPNNTLAMKAMPMTYITKDDPPFLIMHGDKDDLIPIEQSRILHNALLAGGVDSTFTVVKGAGHLQGFKPSHIKDNVVPFLNRHLKGTAS